jgi:plastocyanin
MYGAPAPQPPERSLGTAFAALLFLAALPLIAGALVGTGFTNGVGAGPFAVKMDEPLLSDGALVVRLAVGNQGSVAGSAACDITSSAPGDAGLHEVVTTERIAPGAVVHLLRRLTAFDGRLRPIAVSCGSTKWPKVVEVVIEPTPEPTPAPSLAPGESPAPTASAAPAGPSIVAMGVAFTTASLTVPAGAAFDLRFDNQDAGIPHNVAIRDAAGAEVFTGEIFPGSAVKTYQVPAIAAGSYTFVCTVHPNMRGELTAQ